MLLNKNPLYCSRGSPLRRRPGALRSPSWTPSHPLLPTRGVFNKLQETFFLTHANASICNQQKSAVKPDRTRKPPTNYAMRRACCAPLRPSQNTTEGKSRGVEDPFGRSPEGSALWWGPGAKPLVAAGETRVPGQSPCLTAPFQETRFGLGCLRRGSPWRGVFGARRG